MSKQERFVTLTQRGPSMLLAVAIAFVTLSSVGTLIITEHPSIPPSLRRFVYWWAGGVGGGPLRALRP